MKFSALDTLELSAAERVRLVSDIWETIHEHPDSVELTPETLELLERRLENYRSDPSQSQPWRVAMAELRREMVVTLILTEEAKQDLRDGHAWYAEISAALGARFFDEVERALQRIESNPLAHPRVSGSIRKALTRRFPYLVLYSHESGGTVLLAVLHAGQNPTRFRRRVPS